MDKEKNIGEKESKLAAWVQKKHFQLAIINVLLMILVLLSSAGYFAPYFPITINVIVIFGVLASIFLLKLDSRFAFGVALIFWVLAALFRSFRIIPWAERTAIYSFEALAIGTIHFLVEMLLSRSKNVQR